MNKILEQEHNLLSCYLQKEEFIVNLKLVAKKCKCIINILKIKEISYTLQII